MKRRKFYIKKIFLDCYIKNTGSLISFHFKLNEIENLYWSFVTLSFITRHISPNNFLSPLNKKGSLTFCSSMPGETYYYNLQQSY